MIAILVVSILIGYCLIAGVVYSIMSRYDDTAAPLAAVWPMTLVCLIGLGIALGGVKLGESLVTRFSRPRIPKAKIFGSVGAATRKDAEERRGQALSSSRCSLGTPTEPLYLRGAK